MRVRSILLAALLVLTALVYWPGLHGPLVLDDSYNLAPLNQWIRGEQPWQWVVFSNRSGMFGRPVSMASFVLNVLATGDGIWGLKLGNLLLHLVNGMLVYALFGAWLRAGAAIRDPGPATRWMPLAGTAIWLLHPLFVSTVLYVVQRMAMLSTCFTLLALLCYTHGRLAFDAGHRRRALALLCVAMPVATLLATLAKENGILAVALCGLVELFAFAPRAGARGRVSKAFVIVVLVLPALGAIVLTGMHAPQVVDGYLNRPFTLTERLLTQPRVLWNYVGSLLLPQGPRLGLYHDDFPVSHGVWEPWTTLPAIAAWLAAGIAAWRLRHAIPSLGLGLGVFLVGQALESTVFPLLMYFEHRTYLPAVGLVWALVGGAWWLGQRLARHLHHARALAIICIAAILATLSLATAARAGVWQSRAGLLLQGLEHHPGSRWLRMDLVIDSVTTRQPPDYETARIHVQAMRGSPDPSTRRMAAATNLVLNCAQKETAAADDLKTAFAPYPDAIEADLLLTMEAFGENTLTQGCPGVDHGALAHDLQRMTDTVRMPQSAFFVRRLRFLAARLYLSDEDPRAALAQARKGFGGHAEDAPIGLLQARLEAHLGELEAARRTAQRVSSAMGTGDRQGQQELAEFLRALDQAGTAPRQADPARE